MRMSKTKSFCPDPPCPSGDSCRKRGWARMIVAMRDRHSCPATVAGIAWARFQTLSELHTQLEDCRESTPWEKSSSNSCSCQQKPDTVMKSIASTHCHARIIESQKGDCIGYGDCIIQGPWFRMIGKGNQPAWHSCWKAQGKKTTNHHGIYQHGPTGSQEPGEKQVFREEFTADHQHLVDWALIAGMTTTAAPPHQDQP
ncbi:unnamed protein product [Sphagnum balticum]